MGWLFLFGGAALLLLAGWRMKLPRGGLLMLATVLSLAAAGYAAQGRPSLASTPGEKLDDDKGKLAEMLIDVREPMDRNFGPHVAPLALADSALRNGNGEVALAAIAGALKNNPGNSELLNARALAFYILTGGELTPAVRLAFEQARDNSQHPGPDYFEGLAELFNENPDRTEALWESALTKGSPSGEWRPSVEAQLAALREMKAEAAAAEARETAPDAGD